jgi:hypothetical protein
MTRHQGTESVESGLYLNLKHLSFKPLSERGTLPGTKNDTYYRVPMIVMFLAAPLLGLAYVIFLPVLGFAMVAYLLGTKGVQVGANAAYEAARVLRPSWEPSLAFLSRAKKTAPKDTTVAEPKDEWAEAVEKKLNDETRG